MKSNMVFIFVGALFICIGLFSLKVALQKVRYMDRQREKGIEPAKNLVDHSLF